VGLADGGWPLKTFAARSLLLKLAQRHELRLPPVRAAMRPLGVGIGSAGTAAGSPVASPAAEASLSSLQPLEWQLGGHGLAGTSARLGLPAALSLSGLQSVRWRTFAVFGPGRSGAGFAVHLVGAAAWQCAPRDGYIGWSAAERRRACPGLAITVAFSHLPWVAGAPFGPAIYWED